MDCIQQLRADAEMDALDPQCRGSAGRRLEVDDASLCDGNSPRVLLDGQGEAASEVQADPLADDFRVGQSRERRVLARGCELFAFTGSWC